MGLLDPLYWVVSWILVTVHSALSPVFGAESGWAWGLSIVVLVILVRICLIPLFVKQIKAQRNMQLLSPQMKEIQKKYKDNRERQSQELMKLYRETGSNPLSGCLPILAQSPFFFALFHVLSYVVAKDNPAYALTRELTASARQATVLGAPLAGVFTMSPAKIMELGGHPTATKVVCVVMIVLMSGSTFLTQRQMMLKNLPNTGDNPFLQQQKILLYVFPLMFAVFGINFPVGVLIYWLTTNVWTMGQQFWVIHHNPSPGTPAYDAHQARQARKAARRAERRGAPQLNGKEKEEALGGAVITSSINPPLPVRQQPKRQTRSQRKKR